MQKKTEVLVSLKRFMKHNVNVSYWVSYIEDQNVYFMGMSDSNEDLLNDFKSITNSIILLNQY